jgi:hypothetical protein
MMKKYITKYNSQIKCDNMTYNIINKYNNIMNSSTMNRLTIEFDHDIRNGEYVLFNNEKRVSSISLYGTNGVRAIDFAINKNFDIGKLCIKKNGNVIDFSQYTVGDFTTK